MSQITHNVSFPNDGLGDPLREAFTNQNTMNTELYENKVDKVSGKDLSSNDFTDALKTKLENCDENAEENVQSDWNEEDDTNDAYIKNKPTLEQFASVIGFFDYKDVTTQTTPISLVAATDTQLTNDGAGVDSNYDNKPFGVDNIWDVATSRFDFSQLSIGDLVKIRLNTTLTTDSANQTINTFLILAEGSASELVRLIKQSNVKVAADNQQTVLYSFYIHNQDYIDNPGKLYVNTDDTGSIKIDSLFIEVCRRSVNITEIIVDGEIPPTTPIASSTESGTVKTDIDEVDPVVYTKTTVDTLLDGKSNVLDEHFKGLYTTEANLNIAHPTANSGDYAIVDPGAGTDAVKFIWDIDEGWIAGGSGAGLVDGDKGDIVVSGAGTVFTVDQNAVTYTKAYNGIQLAIVNNFRQMYNY